MKWSVTPDRTRRKNCEMERWVLKQSLLAPAARKRFPMLTAPFEVYGGDKPDIWVLSASGSVGIEVAEVTSQLHARAQTLAQRHGLPIWSIPNSKSFPSRPNETELVKKMRDGDVGGWRGYEPEIEFAQIVRRIVEDKASKSPNYEAAGSLVLLLYDNSGLPVSEESLAGCEALQMISAAAQGVRDRITSVAILMGDHLLVL